MSSERINVRLPEALYNHVVQISGEGKGSFYQTPSEYIRDLIRRDIERDAYHVQQKIIQGFQDIKEGKYFEGSGNFHKDMEIFEKREAEDWK